MAKFELKFIDYKDNTYIETFERDDLIVIFCEDPDGSTSKVCIELDKSTAIKFAKTLRTEINKIVE